jgi:hypothetical protein
MPHQLVSTDSTARGMEAVTAIFGAGSGEGALDSPLISKIARPRRLVAFIGANHAIAQAIRPGRRPAIAATQRPPEPRLAESTSQGRPPGRKSA